MGRVGYGWVWMGSSQGAEKPSLFFQILTDFVPPCVVPVSGEARRHQDFGRRFEGCRKVDGLVLGIGRRQVGAVLRPAFATERWRIGD
jgi:hypothetical protein